MVNLLIFILALIVLYILSRIFVQKLFIVLYRFTKSREKAAVLLGWIFLPGTFVHEISHFITALFLIVPVGNLSLMPEITDNGIKLGSVGIGKTDFIRGSLIGLAPLLVGGTLIFFAISFASGNLSNLWIVGGLIYLIFQITHTMFSSKTDLRAVLELVVFLIIISATLYLLKINYPFVYIYQKVMEINPLIQKISYFLFIPIALELIFLGLFRKVDV